MTAYIWLFVYDPELHILFCWDKTFEKWIRNEHPFFSQFLARNHPWTTLTTSSLDRNAFSWKHRALVNKLFLKLFFKIVIQKHIFLWKIIRNLTYLLDTISFYCPKYSKNYWLHISRQRIVLRLFINSHLLGWVQWYWEKNLLDWKFLRSSALMHTNVLYNSKKKFLSQQQVRFLQTNKKYPRWAQSKSRKNAFQHILECKYKVQVVR